MRRRTLLAIAVPLMALGVILTVVANLAEGPLRWLGGPAAASVIAGGLVLVWALDRGRAW